MKEKKNRIAFFSVFVAVILLFLGFWFVNSLHLKREEKNSHENIEEVIPAASLVDAQVVSKVITLPDKENEKTDVSILRKKINLYILDEEGTNTLPVVSFVKPDKFFPKTVAEAVLLALGDRSFETKINEVKEEDEALYVDLKVKDPSIPFGSVKAKEEELVLNCISYSLLDNFTKIRTIFFTMNGEVYTSKNIKLEKDKPFISQ